jgi:pimeloyl-ACP methyl ester carboxylesterase
LIFVHGEQRDADVYERIAEKALALGSAGHSTFLIVPQFLETQDVADRRDRNLLRWSKGRWIDGLPADDPSPISSFSVLDAILDRLADRTAFPALKTVVIAGHSAGAQLVQRYAAVGREERALRERGIAVRYVVANPSSYVYFNADRPTGQGSFAPFDASQCPSFDHWKYGLGHLPPYVAADTIPHLEDAYAARDVVYLIGTADNDPHQAALDRTCPAEAQGPQRYARAHAYFSYLQQRHPAFAQRIFDVPGAGHSATAMFTSATALPILFE